MQNSNELIVNQFEVEELETRLENKWGKPLCLCFDCDCNPKPDTGGF